MKTGRIEQTGQDAAESYQFVVSADDVGRRLDQWLVHQLPSVTRSFLQKLIAEQQVWVGGKSESKHYRLRLGEQVLVNIPPPAPLMLTPEPIPLNIVYEDADLLVVNKDKGMVVHPAAGNDAGTLVHALLHHCGDSLSGIHGTIRPGIVHRLDKDTSGLLVVAKQDQAHQSLAAQLKAHTVLREYQAMVYGRVAEDAGEINLPIGRSPNDRKKMCVTTQNAKQAITQFEVIERFSDFTWLRFRLKTGRTHQIRVHMAHCSHPIAGDVTYGPKKVITTLSGQCLHAKTIGFVHPTTEQWMEFESELHPLFADFVTKLRQQSC